jgi:hypothetical protein
MRAGDARAAHEQFAYTVELARQLETSGRGGQAALVYEQLAIEPAVPAPIRAAARARLGSASR